MKREIRFLSIALVLFFLCGGGELFAQHKYEFSGHGGFGLSTLNYETAVGEQKNGFGENFGFGFRYFFKPNWGVGSGLELAIYNAKFTMDDYEIRYITYDNVEKTDFEFRSRVRNYEDKQRAILLQIPLMLQYRTLGKRQFNAGAGVKIGIPVNGKYEATADLHNCGYYDFENNEPCYDTQEFRGFGDFLGRKSDGNLDFNTAYFISAEAGIKLKQLSEKISLHAGAYLDYGLNNILKDRDVASLPLIVEYGTTDPNAFRLNGVMNSRYAQSGGALRTFTDKVKPLAVGVKVSLVFGKN